MYYGPIHTNSNVIAAIDIRVGGESPEMSDLLEICMLPLNHSYKPSSKFAVFTMKFRPSHLIDPKVSGIKSKEDLEVFSSSSYDPIDAQDILNHWIAKLELSKNKKILPLSWNWIDKKPWIKHWLGSEYEMYFDESYRDPLAIINFINDRNDYHGDEIQFKHPTFGQFLNRQGIKLFESNSLIANCVAMSEGYRNLLHNR